MSTGTVIRWGALAPPTFRPFPVLLRENMTTMDCNTQWGVRCRRGRKPRTKRTLSRPHPSILCLFHFIFRDSPLGQDIAPYTCTFSSAPDVGFRGILRNRSWALPLAGAIAYTITYASAEPQSALCVSKWFGAIPLGHFFTGVLLLNVRSWKLADALSESFALCVVE
jgi:hypothetical protein